jgi:pimeloyl-ACP methyl ester carboxylesterase
MDKVSRGSVTLNARAVGTPTSARPVLLIHGLNANMAFWHPVLVRELAARRLVVMYDQRGHGRSDMPASGYTPDELARDAAAVLDAYGIGEADVVAHSFGSTVALQLARLFPTRVRSLALLDARLRLFQPALKLADWPDFERWKTSLGAAGERLDAELAADFMLPLYLADASVRQANQNLRANGFAPLGGGRRGAARSRRLLDETTAATDFQNSDGIDLQWLRSVACPVLAIYGSRSPFLETLTGLRREIPGCTTHLVDQGGHNFPVLYPERTAALLTAFLERQHPTGYVDANPASVTRGDAGAP